MQKSYRIKTDIGTDKNIRININQDFDFLEILSLKLRQEDVYTRFCADYGVVAGRVITNGGYGLPNVNVSIFIPLSSMDETDPVISTLYPYKRPEQKNEDGYRYNLLPYVQEYGGHTPTGTFPDREDILKRKEVLEVYEKYYKFTVKTNDSGDFMIIGVPLGMQVIVMDLDLSNIGCFSLRPADMIRMGIGTASQFNGPLFKSSTDLSTLPQIINAKKDIDVASFWGEEDICNIGITRIDFDLRDYGIEIIPQSVFMGSIFSTNEEDFLKANCKPKKNAGNLCDCTASSGKILSIRQTIGYDGNGQPILEQYSLPEGGDVIDDEGAWVVELPMNLDYVTTNEFGETVISNDPKVGIPTKGKYRFRIQYQNEEGMNNQIMRADYLVPNIREYGWDSTGLWTNVNQTLQLKSYAFSLDWNDYADPQAAINCDDYFYEFKYNKVYTIANFIDRWKWGYNRSRHLGIKEITDRTCSTTNNRFPVNDGVRNFDFLFFLFNILITLLSPIILILIVLCHVLAFIYPIIRLIINLLIWLINVIILGICKAIKFLTAGSRPKGDCESKKLKPLPDDNPFKRIALPMMSYPDCEACPCEEESPPPQTGGDVGASLQSTIASQVPSLFGGIQDNQNYLAYRPGISNSGLQTDSTYSKFSQIFAGYQNTNDRKYKTPYFSYFGSWYGEDVTLTQSCNLMNLRSRYFSNENVIKTTIENYDPTTQILDPNPGTFTDLPLIMFVEPGTSNQFEIGDIITLYDPNSVSDPNLTGLNGSNITGTTPFSPNLVTVTKNFIDVNGQEQQVNMKLKLTADSVNYEVKSGFEYFQVIYKTKISQLQTPSFAGLIYNYITNKKQKIEWAPNPPVIQLNTNPDYPKPLEQLSDFSNYEIIVYTRGTDPYTPKQRIKYDLSKIFGKPDGTIVQTGDFYLNIPIQKNSGSGSWWDSSVTPESHYVTNNSNTVLYHEPYGVDFSNLFTGFTNNNPYLYNSTDKLKANFTAYPPQPGEPPLNHFTDPDGVDSDTNTVGPFVTGPNYVSFDIANGFLEQGNIEGGTLLGYDKLFNGNPVSRAYSPAYITENLQPIQLVNNSNNLVFRSDRLPTSDSREEYGNNSFSLHMNVNFKFYISNRTANSTTISSQNVATDTTNNSQDLQGDTQSAINDVVLGTLACENMTVLACYQGNGTSFTVNQNCPDNPNGKRMKGGCYYLVDDILIASIPRDVKLFVEWRSRFRLTFGACRGIFSHVFQNNWVNGTLYMFSFKKRTVFNITGQPKKYKYCGTEDTVASRQGVGPVFYTLGTTNSLFYRSTPYDGNDFVGQETQGNFGGMNDRNLYFPTTIMDLGPRDQFVKDICYDPSFQGHIVDTIKSTSFGDTSDILSLFFISRLINSNFWGQALGLGDASINRMFSRSEDRMDGDAVQLFSINSEYGVIPFDDDSYDDNSFYVSSNGDPLLGIFFSSNTENRRVISPGITTFSDTPLLTDYYGYPNSQIVPVYQWKAQINNTIFGNDKNDWHTSTPFYSQKYQNLNFTPGVPISPYFNSTNTGQKGYIYNENSNGVGVETWPSNQNSQFIVGAPYHFYFGLRKGKSAINRFITKYILNTNE